MCESEREEKQSFILQIQLISFEEAIHSAFHVARVLTEYQIELRR